VGDERLRPLASDEAADGLGRRREARVVRGDQRPGDDRRHPPVAASSSERGLERVEEEEADRGLRLRAAPVERDRRDDVRRQLVLHEQVADLRAVAVGEDDLDPVGDQVGDGVHGGRDRALLGLDRRRSVGPGHGVAAEGDERAHLPPSFARRGSVGARRARQHG
jgi:hypothetical protein